MIKITKIITPIFVIFSFITSTGIAQSWHKNGRLSHEVGFMAGSSSFTTDYGQRFNFQANVGGNVGPGFGLIYYLTFADYRYRWNQRTSYWEDHFRIRTELSYFSAKLNHYGIYVDGPEDHREVNQLRAMNGLARALNFGSQLEYHLVNITDFGSRRNKHLRFSPYGTFGFLIVYSNPELYSDWGDGNWIEDQSILYDKWEDQDAVDVDPKVVFSLTAGFGSRYKISEFGDVFIEAKWQAYISNWVDGLNAKKGTPSNPNPNNLFNDWNLFLHVGYIYYLN